MKTKPEDQMITVFAATAELISVLRDDSGIPVIDILAGMHGEIVRQLVAESGFEMAEKYLCASLKVLYRVADSYRSNPDLRLLDMMPAGAA